MYKMDPVKAYELFLSKNKQKRLQASCGPNEGATAFSAPGSGFAPSEDPGFVYGTPTMNSKREAYLRIERNEPIGWKIALLLIRL